MSDDWCVTFHHRFFLGTVHNLLFFGYGKAHDLSITDISLDLIKWLWDELCQKRTQLIISFYHSKT